MNKWAHTPGFTLVELMVVVAVLGILGGIAVAAYGAYIKRSRNTEATALISDIRLKQEAYRGTFHQYANLATECTWVPDNTPGPDPQPLAWSTPECEGVWRQLGSRPPTGMYFVYAVEAGPPGGTPAAEYTANGINSSTDFWYGISARQDLDGDGECGGFVSVSGVMKIIEVPESSGACP